MNFTKLYRNPEARKITIKFIIILIIGVAAIAVSSFAIAKSISKTLINQNAAILADVLENKKDGEIIKNFYQEKSEEEVNSAKEVLSQYGYDSNMSLDSNQIVFDILKKNLIIFIVVIVVFLSILYFCFIRELNKIYSEIDQIVTNTKSMSKGQYKNIQGYYTEGEMAILVSTLNYMGERVNNSIELLKADKENLKDFLADISHQLKTPLASLVMFNDLLRENQNMSYEDRMKFLDKSEEQLRRMEWLIMNLLKVGRLEANAIDFENEIQPLSDAIDLALSSLSQEAKNKNQKLIVCGDVEAKVLHDKEWLSEALSNIIKNSIEHTGEYGEIKIEVIKGPIITKIYIKDNGPGIPKELQKKVFKRFYKGENSQNPKSIGIGLSLSKSIIEKMNGEIKLVSEAGKGSTFIISFFS